MIRSIRNLTAILFVFGALAISAQQASAQAMQDFTLVNKTGVEIYGLYVTPHNADDWGEDILGVDTLASNELADISFSPRERAKLWDLRVEDEEGTYIEWERLNLLEISQVTLFYKNGKATAVVE